MIPDNQQDSSQRLYNYLLGVYRIELIKSEFHLARLALSLHLKGSNEK
jgi:hypothetical protein